MRRIYGKKGYILLATIIVTALIFFFAVLYASFFHNYSRNARKAEETYIAIEAGNAGIESAISRLQGDSAWDTGFSRIQLPNSGADYTVTFDKNAGIPYSVNNSQGNTVLTGYNGRQVQPGHIHLVSIGRYGSTSGIEQAYLTSGPIKPFSGAAHVQNNVIMNGNATVNSWDSDNGSYAQTVQNSGGNIISNLTGTGIVSLTGNVQVHGNITTGTGSVAGTAVHSSGNSSYDGFTTQSPQTFPVITPTPGTSLGAINNTANPVPGTYTGLSGSGNSIINLSAGEYIILGNVNLSGNSEIRLPSGSGRVTLHVLGNISITGNSIKNETGKPGNLVITGGPDTQTVSISGNGTGSFALYAPTANVNINGNAEIYGSIVANNLNMVGNGGLHFDNALTGMALGGGSGLSLKSRW